MFISNTLQRFVIMKDILTSISTSIVLYFSLLQNKKVVSEVKSFGKVIAP